MAPPLLAGLGLKGAAGTIKGALAGSKLKAGITGLTAGTFTQYLPGFGGGSGGEPELDLEEDGLAIGAALIGVVMFFMAVMD